VPSRSAAVERGQLGMRARCAVVRARAPSG